MSERDAATRKQRIDFLRGLRKYSECKTDSEFANLCDKNRGDLSSYLSGNIAPPETYLKQCLEKIASKKFEWTIEPIVEIEDISTAKRKLPASGGVYVIFDSGSNVLYVGKAGNLKSEVKVALKKKISYPMRIGPTMKKKSYPTIESLASYLSAYSIDSKRMRHNLEALLIRLTVNQTHNQNIGNFL